MKKIKTTRGMFALVDDEDYVFLSQWKWTSAKRGYVMRHSTHRGRSRTIWMHRVLLGYFGSQHIDHADRNPLNNQKHNLRIATAKQNGRNKAVYQNNTLGIRGVRKSGKNSFMARIKGAGNKEIHLGSFPTAVLASRAYDAAAKKQFGEWACLNNL